MEVLTIGNSFSQDATRYLHAIARADGEKINVINLCIGGCSLERHYRNMLSGERAYALECNGHNTDFRISLDEALLNRQWDVITLQQASHFSFNEDTYHPYVSALADYVCECSPKAKIYLHNTWAYERDSQRLLEVAKYETPKKMLEDIVKAYSSAAKVINADGIIPSGQLFGKLSENGITNIHRDTFHASRGVGRYALGLLWYKVLTGKSVLANEFCDFDEPISDGDIKIIKNTVESLF